MAALSKVDQRVSVKIIVEKSVRSTADEFEIIQEDVTNKEFTEWPLILKSMGRCPQHEKVESARNVEAIMEMWKGISTDFVERMFLLRYFSITHSFVSTDGGEISIVRQRWIKTDFHWILRRSFLEISWDDPNSVQRLRQYFTALVNMKEKRDAQSERKFFQDIGITASIRSLSKVGMPSPHSKEESRFAAIVRLGAREYCLVFLSFVQSCYEDWNCVCGKRILRKFAGAVLKYSKKDREEISNVLAGKRDVAKQETYLERLFDAVGKRRFVKILFGRVHQCATCGATNREKWLFGCKKCSEDGLYPKRRYCDVECQKIDWSKHREEHKKHSETGQKEKRGMCDCPKGDVES